MAKYLGKAVSISTFKIKQCKLVSTVTVLCTHNFVCTNVRAKPFYVHENQCTQISNLSSPDCPWIVVQSYFHTDQCFLMYSLNDKLKITKFILIYILNLSMAASYIVLLFLKWPKRVMRVKLVIPTSRQISKIWTSIPSSTKKPSNQSFKEMRNSYFCVTPRLYLNFTKTVSAFLAPLFALMKTNF